jgi:two-component system sensor histidine kinase UhpB
MAMMASAPVRTEDLTGQWASVPDRAAVGRAAASASPPRRLVDRLWYRLSVRAQLLLTFIAIGLVASLVAGAVTVLLARKSTRLEIAASLRMAEILVGETTELLQQELSADQFLINLPAQLRSVRHLRVTVRDMSGAPVSSDVADARTDGRAPPPAWFAALIAPPVVTREQPVVTKGERIGSVLLTGEASDEISEVWENTVDFALVSLLVGLVAIAALHLLLGRVLDPLTALYAGLVDLEQRNYRVRLTRPKALELAAITDRFNSLAHALDALPADHRPG